MKRRFVCRWVVLLLVSALVYVSCKEDDDKEIPYGKLPAVSQQFLETYFPNVSVGRIDKSSDEPRYRVTLNNGFGVRFFASGEWQEVDGNGNAIPYSMQLGLLPLKLLNYAGENFPAAEIIVVSRQGAGYEIELNTVPETWIHIDAFDNITVNTAE